MEGNRLAGQRRFLFPLFRPVVRDGKTEKGRGAIKLLVVEPDGLSLAAVLRTLPTRFGFHFCLRLHVDSLHPKPDDSLPSRRGALELPGLWEVLGAAIEFLLRVRGAVGGAFAEGHPLIHSGLVLTKVSIAGTRPCYNPR